MNIDEMNEEEVKLNFITPAIERAGWKRDLIRMEYVFTAGKMIVQGRTVSRGKQKKADYVLFHKANLPLAIVEAKDGTHSVGDGMQQALEYARVLDIPFVYSSNGKGFLEHDMRAGMERELSMDALPSPEALWERFKAAGKITPPLEAVMTTPYYFDPLTSRSPRYYQRVAINRTVDAIAQGQKRILLVMATGTGKTYTAFQIIHRLREAGLANRVLFLADRNILVDQTMTQDFKPFQKVMTKIEGRKPNSAYEVYLSLYQQLAGDENEEPFRTFQPDFFDLIVVDECHRGSAKADSLWRKILEYFSGAAQIGMTATPKETKEVSNINYFGEPIYTYSLKQGIEDGFLAPYKVCRVGLSPDLLGWRPAAGQKDLEGELIEDREYNSRDFDRTLIIDERTQLVADRITAFLKKHDRFAKTIVFCMNIDHAERLRQALVKANSDLVAKDSRYVMRITGDSPEGKAQLDNFIDVETTYPVIVTTSKLLTTGVDCKTCKVIVLDTMINSMTEFKQIIGRGTRLNEEYRKFYFTILDFRNACRLFADPDFDGEPIKIYEEGEDEGEDAGNGGELPPLVGEGGNDPGFTDIGGLGMGPDDPMPTPVYHVRGVEVTILHERVQYYDADGKLTTESIADFSKRNIRGEYATLEAFLKAWNSATRKQAIIDELKERGVLIEALREVAGNKDIGDFDLICHIAYDQPPLTRAERVNNVRKRGYLFKYQGLARDVLEALLTKYMEGGIHEIDSLEVLSNDPLRQFGAPPAIVRLFGGKEGYLKALHELQKMIFAA